MELLYILQWKKAFLLRIHNPSHNILRLFDILPNFLFLVPSLSPKMTVLLDNFTNSKAFTTVLSQN